MDSKAREKMVLFGESFETIEPKIDGESQHEFNIESPFVP